MTYVPRRINCCQHTATYNYLDYHLRGGEYSGSGNTIFNFYGCHGHNRGFWGGLGLGAGLGLGSWFGGLFSNILGSFGFGGCGFGGFGGMFGNMSMGGFGFPSFGFGGNTLGNGGGISSLWGGNSTNNNDKVNNENVTKKSKRKSEKETDGKGGIDSSSDVKVVDDKDQAKLREIDNALNALKTKANPTKEEAQAIYNDIKNNNGKDLTQSPLDGHYSDVNKPDYNYRLQELLNFANAKGWTIDGNENGLPANDENGAAAINAAGNDESSPNRVAAPKANETGNIQGGNNPSVNTDETGNGNGNDIKNGQDLANKLGNMDDNAKDLNFIKTIPDNVKKQYYLSGYTNYDGKSPIEAAKMKDAQDCNGFELPRNVANVNGKNAIIEQTENSHPTTIKIQDKQTVTYTFVGKAGSEYIYESQNGQLYALQKDNNGEYHLMQYAYMKGYNLKDISMQ